MKNIDFFKKSLKNEFQETYKAIGCIHQKELSLKNNAKNRNLGEIISQILNLYQGLNNILKKNKCHEIIEQNEYFKIDNCKKLYKIWTQTEKTLNLTSKDKWNKEYVILFINNIQIISNKRSKTMWFVLWEIKNERKLLMETLMFLREENHNRIQNLA